MTKAFSEAQVAAEPGEVQSFLAACRESVDQELDKLVPAETVEPLGVHSAMRWSLFAGGKRFRPALLLAVVRAFEADQDCLIRTACALEMIHTYSLIHDDLPSMDDDDMRRGRPSCHVKFGEATAILAGDALQALAFQAIAEDDRLELSTRVRVISDIARAAGTPSGMVAGQAFDLDAESRDVTAAELETIHSHKTGALIRAAATSGAIISGANVAQLDALARFGQQLGLLFQITDDLLDVTASAEDLGKTPGKDARSLKATYPSLYGVEMTEQLARAAHQNACRTLDEIATSTTLLRAIADFILDRHG